MGPVVPVAPLAAREVVAKLKGSGRVSFVAISAEAADDGFDGAACFEVATTALALDADVVCAARRCAVAIWACNTCVCVFHWELEYTQVDEHETVKNFDIVPLCNY